MKKQQRKMRTFLGTHRQQGFTLFSLIVAIVLVGVALPFIFTLIGQVAHSHAENEILLKCVHLAQAKIEEISAYKSKNSDWQDNIESYAGTENLAEGFTRTVQVTSVTDYQGTGVEVYQVQVSVAQTQFQNPYELTMIFAKSN